MIKKVAHRNLLDNSDFRNPVNQRGQTIYTASGYTIDRWICNGGTVEINNGVSFSTSYVLLQILEKNIADGVIRTFAMGTNDGAVYCCTIQAAYVVLGDSGYSITYDSGEAVYISRTSENALPIAWVALYEGEYTIDTLPEYQPKGYDAELLACQTQLQRFRTESERKTHCEDFRPTMRMTTNGMVSKFEQEIDGVTYYFASAEL